MQEIVQIALMLSGHASENDVENANSEPALKAKAFYAYHLSDMLSRFPWPFACRRARLERAEVPTHRYPYAYRRPEDASHVWDLYTDKQGFRDDGVWDPSVNYSPLAWTNAGLALEGANAETIGDYIESDSAALYCYYTSTARFTDGQMTSQFRNGLVDAIVLSMLKSKKADPDTMRTALAEMERKRMESYALASRGGHTVEKLPTATIIRNIRGGS